MSNEKRLLVGITGASGSVLAERLIEECLNHFDRIYVTVTDTGRKVIAHELDSQRENFSLGRLAAGSVDEKWRSKLRVFDVGDFFAPMASGTSAPNAMVVVPCSMGTMARIAHGMSLNLLERSADVIIKERKKLVIVPRETPLSTIHLDNMQILCRAGATILPPMPGFYQKPKTFDDVVNFIVGRILENLDVQHDLYKPWNSRMR